MLTIRQKALAVHFFTASGAVLAMLAMLAAIDQKWGLMYLWLVIAFIVDGLDGPLARKYDVKTNAPQFDGVILDMIIDYLTYIFIPAFALFSSGLMDGWSGWAMIIIVTFSSALYMCDTGMKTKDNSFAGFPACWNMVVLVFFATKPPWAVCLVLVAILAATMFVRVKFVHPVRTDRWRAISLPMMVAWMTLAIFAAWLNFEELPGLIYWGILVTSIYLLGAGAVQQLTETGKDAGSLY